MEIKQHTSKLHMIGEQISRDIKVYFAVNENKNKAYQICGMQEKLCLEGNL